MSRTANSPPGSPSRAGRSEDLAATTAAISTAIVGDPADVRWDRPRRRGRRLPMANASLYEPAAGRSQWWLSIRCPYGCGIHLGRVPEESHAAGPRRTGCGRKVFVVVRQTYRARPDLGAAA